MAKKVQSPFKKVLYATDFSVSFDGELQAAFHFCQTNEASLRILHVRKTGAARGTEVSLLMETGILENDALRVLDQLKERALEAGVSCKTSLETGVASARILEAIEAGKIDLAILGTSEPRGSKHLAFGPTAEAVMRKASCPIMTVGPVAADLSKTNALSGPVVFATDFHSVTRQAIRLAVSYCKGTGLRLHCLHVLPRTLQPTDGDKTLPELLTCALKHLVATSAVSIDAPVCCVTFGSEISNTVVDYARQQQASLIFLGVRRASMIPPDDPLPIVFRIITEAPCPVVMILCDDEFDSESPVDQRSTKSDASPLHLQ
jgi:nucleotide-binding universal stress UspA family protein